MAPHALVIPCPAVSHMLPMMQFSEKIASKGILVTFVNTQHSHAMMTEFLRLGDENRFHTGYDNLRFAQISDGLPLDFDRSAHFDEFLVSIDNMGGALEDLICELNQKDPPVTCIIADSFLPWTLDVAKKFDLTWVFFWTQSISVYAMYYHLPDIIANGHFPPKKSGNPMDTRVDYIPGLPSLQPQDLTSFIQTGDTSEFLLQLIIRQFKSIHQADWIIGNTVYELERGASDAVQLKAPICSVGPLLPLSDYLDLQLATRSIKNKKSSLRRESSCLSWLDSKPTSSVLYVSFGSVVHISKAQVEEIAMGLLESEQSFLWVIRPDVVNSDASDVLPKVFIEGTKDRGLLVPWAPQVSVLSHPSVGGFFSHCGWNSTLESLSLGVPLLTFPQWSDQYTNRMLIVDQWKIGLRLIPREDGIVERQEIAKAVKTLMQREEGNSMRKRAMELREISRRAVDEEGSSSETLQAFVDDMLTR
eukprot:Gb_14879 [translate_table: standard]